jgi:RNA polymerase sigma-B factor
MVRVSRREHEKSRPPFAHTSLDACLPCGTPFVDLLTADPVTTDQADESPEELEALVEQLPAADAAALRLTLLQGMSLRQAGEALGVSVMTAQRRKERAVKAIREALQA